LSILLSIYLFLEYHGPSWCLSPADRGLCQASEKRFYYNAAIGKCRQFKYTGCGGNNNNFTTKKDCVRACKKGMKDILPIKSLIFGMIIVLK
ncbi:Tissue factor pathway inhibitor, partial [Lemmus lemmus]